MRLILLALLASTGCEQILGLEDIDPAGGSGDDDPANSNVTGRVVVYPRGTGQNNIGVDARDNDTGTILDTSQTTTSSGGMFELTAPTGFDGFIGFFDEGSGLSLHKNSYHVLGAFDSDPKYELTAFETDHASVTMNAELPVEIRDSLFARLEIYDSSTNAFPGTTVRVMGDGPLQIRYTNDLGQPVPGTPSTVIAKRAGEEPFAAAYIFGLVEGASYTFEAEFEDEIVGIGTAIQIQDDTIPTVILKFTNKAAPPVE